ALRDRHPGSARAGRAGARCRLPGDALRCCGGLPACMPARAGVLRPGAAPGITGRSGPARDRSGGRAVSGAQILPGSPDPSDRATDEHLPPEGRAALRAGVVGNWVDNIHVFLPLTALAPAMMVLAGPAAA